MSLELAEPRVAFAHDAPDGVSRHLWTVSDVEGMVRAGVLTEGERVELIEGVLYDMAADGPLHNDWTYALGVWLFEALGRTHVVQPGTTLVLSERNAPKPDYWVFSPELKTSDVRGADVLLAIEQADSSLSYDLSAKAALYAAHGVRDYWVIDIRAKRLYVHRGPSTTGYAETPAPFEADQRVDALLIPGLSLRLADLPRVN